MLGCCTESKKNDEELTCCSKPVLCPTLWHQHEMKYYTTHPVCYFTLHGHTPWLYPLHPLATRRKTPAQSYKDQGSEWCVAFWTLRIRLERRSQTGEEKPDWLVLDSQVSRMYWVPQSPWRGSEGLSHRGLQMSLQSKQETSAFIHLASASLSTMSWLAICLLCLPSICTKCWELQCHWPWLIAPETLPLWLKFKLGFPKLEETLCTCFGRGVLETLSKESVPYQIYLFSQQMSLSTQCMPGTV